MIHKRRPELSVGNAARFIRETALPFLIGNGLDIGCGKWKIKDDAIGVDNKSSPGVDLIINDWNDLLSEEYDYVFSSHCLEHISDWVHALKHWVRVLKPEGVIFLYLPNPKQYNRWSKKYVSYHLHDFTLPIIASRLFYLGVKVNAQGYNNFAGMYITGIKKNIKYL